MNSIGLPLYRTDQHGKQFAKYRYLSIRDYYRMMKKLHWGNLYDRERLFSALLEKDTQRLKDFVSKYIKEESSTFENPGIFVRTDTTVQEMNRVDCMFCYRVFLELFVGDIDEVIDYRS